MLESLYEKIAGRQTCNFIEKILLHWHFPVNIVKFLRIAFVIEYLRWLLLNSKRFSVPVSISKELLCVGLVKND